MSESVGTLELGGERMLTRRQLLKLSIGGLLLGLTACTRTEPAAPASRPSGPPLPPRGVFARTIRDRGRLVVGAYMNTFFSSWDPQSKRVVGFDADIAREISRDLFGDPDRIEWKEVTPATRIPALQTGMVDIVVASLTITQERLQLIDFSDVYYEVTPETSAALAAAARAAGLELAREQLGYEPYGVGIPKERPGFASYVNGVLIRSRLGGRWAAIHQRWLGGYLPTPEPPSKTALEAAA